MKHLKYIWILFFMMVSSSLLMAQVDPDTSQKASIDRFSPLSGHLFIRDMINNLPGPNEPIHFDMEPFLSKGLGPNGEHISYYNFDAQPTEPAPIYVLFKEGESMPVSGQLNIINVIPGDTGYNDFWEVQKVTVPSNYLTNTVTSYQAIIDSGYQVEETTILVNCPVVPDSSTAMMRLTGESAELTEGWYKNLVVYYFNFSEKALMTNQSDMVPISPIFVSFNINPGDPNGGPPSGFKTEMATGRTHNVTATLPKDASYSPLWMVNIYDNADFDKVHDLTSAQAANILVSGAANVNCPIVSLTTAVDPDTASKVSIDRFSAEAGHLFIRDITNMLPGPNIPIDFDNPPFITKGFGPNGELIAYYNFDVQPTAPAPIYVLFRDGESTPVKEQLNIVDDVPGDFDYNDFWEVQKVTVPADYLPNSITSLQEIMDKGYNIEETDIIVNCPIVPVGSVARKRWNGTDFGLTRGWYNGQVVYYFNFAEKALMTNSMDMIDTSPIYVSFNVNPGVPGGGPPSGFKVDTVTGRAHNVAATIPTDPGYSPLWMVNIYDNADFENVHDLTSAQSANILASGAAIVNCPVVAQYVKIDRFSVEAAHLFVRDTTNNLPGPNEPVDFDKEPLMSKGLGPKGEYISYYNFDAQPTEPAPIYVLINSMTLSPFNEQHNIIDVIPGDPGYNDFWEVQTVLVPPDYIPNSITSYQGIVDSGYQINETTTLVNCPVVSEGSTAKMRLNGESPNLTWGWYKGKIVYYFNFSEKALMTDVTDMVPLSPIYVSFNINPGMPGGGPPSGFMAEDSTGRTHNVTATLPADEGYSPLWFVNIYDNADFDMVHDLISAQSANILVTGAANVNCPVVSIQSNNKINPNQFDNFEDGTTQGWISGAPNPNPPTNVTSGGPNGLDDNYLLVTSRGGGGPGSKLVIMNSTQWTGNYLAAGVQSVSMYVKNFDSTDLNLRIVLEGSGGDFWSKNPVVIAGLTDWQPIVFSLQPADLTGGSNVDSTLSSVTMIRIIHSTAGSKHGESIVAQIGLDDITAASEPVPVELASLTAQASNNGVILNWSTATELNNKEFQIQRKFGSGEFVTIGLVKGHGTTTSPNQYSYFDKSLNVGKYYYRLKQIDFSGSYSYSKEVEVEVGTVYTFTLGQNYPNPFNPSTTIKFSVTEKELISLTIYNSIGEKIGDLVNDVLPAGNYLVNWNAENVASGIYFYTLSTKNFRSTKKMILLR